MIECINISVTGTCQGRDTLKYIREKGIEL
uniref:Uncharacterized protein n=1 Tax=Anguilla anguilla TaxID=7936 RepID=A0A0E9S4A8_ANGAN